MEAVLARWKRSSEGGVRPSQSHPTHAEATAHHGADWRSGVMALGALGPQRPASSSYKQQQQSQDGEGDRVSHGWFHGRRRHTHTRGAQSTAVDQSTGGGANARYARLLDPSHASHKVLCYRLVSLPDPSNPWGDGLLLEAARTHASDAALDAALHELLLRNWEDDPLRVEDAAPHRRLTVDTRDSRRRHSLHPTNEGGAGRASGGAANAFEPPLQESHHRVKFPETVAEDAAAADARKAATDESFHSLPTDDDDSFASKSKARAEASTRGHFAAHTQAAFGIVSRLHAHFHRAQTRQLPSTAGGAPESGKTSWAYVLVHGRGTVGETALHLCFLLDTPQHRRLIRILVPWLAKQTTVDHSGANVNYLDAAYVGQPYHGEVCLHFAVVHNDLEMVAAASSTPGCRRALQTRQTHVGPPSPLPSSTLVGAAAHRAWRGR